MPINKTAREYGIPLPFLNEKERDYTHSQLTWISEMLSGEYCYASDHYCNIEKRTFCEIGLAWYLISEFDDEVKIGKYGIRIAGKPMHGEYAWEKLARWLYIPPWTLQKLENDCMSGKFKSFEDVVWWIEDQHWMMYTEDRWASSQKKSSLNG